MSGVGLSELVVLFVIGLLILGPERLPRVASQIGRWVGRARRTANQLRYQLEREIALADIEKKTKGKQDDIAGAKDTGAASGESEGPAPEAAGTQDEASQDEASPQDSASDAAASAGAAAAEPDPGEPDSAEPAERAHERADDDTREA